MTFYQLQSLCEEGQQQLMLMEYIAAQETLIRAERAAIGLNDFETLSRLYMPLQEARRQRRQRCGEGIVNLRLLAGAADDPAIDAARLIEQFPQGQLLIAGWGTLEPARQFRTLQAQQHLYVETYLAAVYPSITTNGPRVVVIVPRETDSLPEPIARPTSDLRPLLPPDAIVLLEDQLPAPKVGNSETYAQTMALWEKLHIPFLNRADNQVDLLQKMDCYRDAIEVDYACELAHQKLSVAARAYAKELARKT